MIALNEKNKVEETGNIQVYNHTLTYDDSVVQLSNIAMITVAPMKKQSIPSWAIWCIIVGFICFSFSPVGGFLLTAVGVCTCAYIYLKNSQLGHYLTLELNNGKSIYFQGKDETFLKSIVKILADTINSDRQVSYNFDLQNAEIHQMQVGDNNAMK